MLKKIALVFLVVILHKPQRSIAQIANTGMVEQMDSSALGKITFSGMVDVYYGYDFNEPKGSDRPYFVSSARHNEVNVNLAYLGINYRNEKVRARFVPGFGTYMNSNYASEAGTLRNIVEANAGLRLSKNRDIWIDAGVFGSPYTNESAISKDHLMYSRSLAPEYVPYYLTGAKITAPLSKSLTGYVYILNGWQNITDTNTPLSIGTQLEYRPGKRTLINFNTFVGDESSPANPDFGMRYFGDVYLIFNPDGKFSMTSCLYGGLQQRFSFGTSTLQSWWQINWIGRLKLNQKSSVSARVEFFNDPQEIMLRSITSEKTSNLASSGIAFNHQINSNALFRLEYRNFLADKNIFSNKNSETNFSNLIITNLCVWF
ncbi:MAG: outer membrane beta-barrel protein [Bacteroidia bacterium]